VAEAVDVDVDVDVPNRMETAGDDGVG